VYGAYHADKLATRKVQNALVDRCERLGCLTDGPSPEAESTNGGRKLRSHLAMTKGHMTPCAVWVPRLAHALAHGHLPRTRNKM
jgi:hypothetical protein